MNVMGEINHFIIDLTLTPQDETHTLNHYSTKILRKEVLGSRGVRSTSIMWLNVHRAKQTFNDLIPIDNICLNFSLKTFMTYTLIAQ